MVFTNKMTGGICPAMRGLALFVFLPALVGCVSASSRFDRIALDHGLARTVVSGRGFQHVIYENAATAPQGGSLHVYIGSDGTPWEFDVPAADPTPRNPITVRLMAQDPLPAVLVGRPCYHGLADSPGCDPSLWTSARYSRAVVDSMTDVVRRYLQQRPYSSVTLVGYSGGGALAALIAAKLNRVATVLTVAANLDTDAWSRYHRYEPLYGSINPAQEPPLPDTIRQLHYFGSLDANVPMSTTDRYFARNSAAERREIEEFDHVCCWETIWRSILFSTEQADTSNARQQHSVHD